MKAVSATAVGQHLDLSRQRIRALTTAGVLRCDTDQRYDLDRARTDYIRWLRLPDRRSARTERNAEIQRLKIRALELKIAKEEGHLAELSEVMHFIDVWIGLIRTELSALPARVTTDNNVRRKIEEAIYDLLTRLSNRASEEAAKLTKSSDP